MIKFKKLYLPELSQMIGKDIAATKAWCKAYYVPIYSIDRKEFVFRSQAENVWIENLVIYLRTEYPADWKKHLRKYL